MHFKSLSFQMRQGTHICNSCDVLSLRSCSSQIFHYFAFSDDPYYKDKRQCHTFTRSYYRVRYCFLFFKTQSEQTLPHGFTVKPLGIVGKKSFSGAFFGILVDSQVPCCAFFFSGQKPKLLSTTETSRNVLSSSFQFSFFL